MILKYQKASVLQLKKKHPCGEDRFVVEFAGSDIKLRCLGCRKELIIERIRLDKMIKKVLPGEEND